MCQSDCQERVIVIVGYARSGTSFLHEELAEELDLLHTNELSSFAERWREIQACLIDPTSNGTETLVRALFDSSFFPMYKTIQSSRYGRTTKLTLNNLLGATKGLDHKAAIFKVLHLLCEENGAERIAFKDPRLTSNLGIVYDLFENVRVVHIVRDGRDCALSMRGVRWGDGNSHETARNWKMALMAARAASFRHREKYLEIRYEDVLSEPYANWLILEKFLTGEASPERARRFADRVAQSGFAKNCYKWQSRMSTRELAEFESQAGDMLREFGYPVHAEYDKGISHLRRLNLLVHSQLSRIWKQRFSKQKF